VFGAILRWFQRRNSWGGWGVFVGMYTLLVALFIPGVAFIMGAGFVFGCAAGKVQGICLGCGASA
jgi:uncharacterized membrane protein YdjX (TVP38/TMEM64 family)